MAYILCLETATTNCSVALVEDGKVIKLKEDYSNQYSHAERLHCFIDDILKETGVSALSLDAIAVSKGPGSYTGLRIGVASAKGLCFALGIPLISVLTLQSLALQVQELEAGVIIPMIDARRMEVYTAAFSGDGICLQETHAKILNEDSYKEFLENNKVYFIGNGVEKFEAVCVHTNANFIKGKLPSANEMATISYDKFIKSDFEDVTYFDPYYLKDFVAG